MRVQRYKKMVFDGEPSDGQNAAKNRLENRYNKELPVNRQIGGELWL